MEINLECSDIFNDEYSQFMDNNSQICINEDQEHQLNQVPPQSQTPLPNILGELAQVDQENNFFKNVQEEQKANDDILELSEIKLDQSRGMDISVNANENEISASNLVSRAPMHVPLINFQQPEIKSGKGVPGNQMLRLKPPQVPLLNLPVNKIDTGKLNSTQNFPFTMTSGSNETKNSQQQLSSTATSAIPNNKQWQKVTIAKRRPTTASQEPGAANGKSAQIVGQRSTSTSVITQPKMPINISNIQNSDLQDNNYPRTYRERLIASPCVGRESIKAETQTIVSKKRKTEPGEIVPLFDCLFCCQEHFVLAKQSETTLTKKYVRNAQCFDDHRGSLFVELSLKGIQDPFDFQKQKQQLQPQISQSFMQPYQASVNQLSLLVSEQPIITPILGSYIKILKTKNYHQRKTINPMPLQPNVKVLNIGAEISDIESDGELNLDGSRVNIKTRRQRIVENISFETECFNIYDPYFTSEEELEASNSEISQKQVTTRRRHVAKRDPSTSSINSLPSSLEESSLEESISPQKGELYKQISKQQDIHHSQDDQDKSLSSIEKHQDDDNDEDEERQCFEGCNLQLQKIQMNQNQSMQLIPVQAVFTTTKILNIQENKFTPEHDVDSQRYTFGCITPKGVTLGGLGSNLQSNKGIFNQASSDGAFREGEARNDPFLIEHDNQRSPTSSKDMVTQLRIPKDQNLIHINKDEQLPEVLYEDPMMSADQSPISCHQNENGRTIQDFSPVILDIANKMDPSAPSTGKQISRIENKKEKIDFYPPPHQLIESIEIASNNLTRLKPHPGQGDDSCDLSLKFGAQAMLLQVPMRNKVIHAPHQSVGGQLRVVGDKDSCFSPIQHDNSLSRDGVYAAVAVREAIQGHYFNTCEDDYDITMAHENEYQQTNQMFGGEPDIAMTSKFPNRFDFQAAQNEYFTGSQDYAPITQGNQIEGQTINLGYQNQSQSFSAFNSKHVDHQTPQVLLKPGRIQDFNHPNVSVAVNINPSENLITDGNQQEPCSTARGKKKGSKKLIIKQEQLSLLLQKALEKRNSQTVSNIIQEGNNTISSDLIQQNQATQSLFDSIIKQGYQLIQNQSQLDANPNQHQVSLSHLDNLQPVVAVSNQLSTSQKNFQPLPKHKKKQKTCDFNKPKSISSSGPKPHQLTLNNHQSAISLNDKRAPKAPGTTIGQNSRKITSIVGSQFGDQASQPKFVPIRSQIEDQHFSRQPIIGAGSRGKNYHLSFNNVLLGSNQAAQRKLMLEMNQDPEADRPLTLRENVQEHEDFIPDQQLAYQIIQSNMHNLAVSPNIFLKANKNAIKKPPQMTREEMAQYLKSAICSSRYSSSSIQPGPALQHHFQQLPEQYFKQQAIFNELHTTSSQNRLSNSNKKRRLNLNQGSQKKRDRRYKNQQDAIVMFTENDEQFENTLVHHQHLSIDQQTTVHKSSAGKLIDRRDSASRLNRGQIRQQNQHLTPSEAAQRLRLAHKKLTNSAEKKERAGTGKQTYKGRKSGGVTIGSKERKVQKRSKGTIPKKEQQQIEFQSYLNLCNSINFSNDVSLAKPMTNPAVSTSLISHSNSSKPLLKKEIPIISTSLINDGNFTSKGGLYNSNAQNSSSIIISGGHQHHYYHNTNQSSSNLNIQDSSQNVHPSILCGAPMNHTSNLPGNEMSTTISGNQLSLTRMVSGGDSRPAIKGNQTISSGGGNINVTTGSGGAPPNMNHTTVISSSKHPKVIVPALQLNRIKSNSTKRKQLNGSHDEIQLQNLLQNLNQHLMANQQQMQTRASVLKDGSNTVTTTPHGGVKITSSFQRGIAAAAAAAQQNMINTKRSQGSSLSLQRQSVVGVSAEAPRKEPSDQYTAKANQAIIIKQLNNTAQNLKKKQDALPMPNLQIKTAIHTAAQKDRRKKSKDQAPLTVMPSSTKNNMLQDSNAAPLKKVLQNSFTLKHLKLMTAVGTNVQTSQQLTGRMIETQRTTERTVSAGRTQQNTSIPNRNNQQSFGQAKEKTSNSQKRLTKLVMKNQQNIIANTKLHLTNQPKEGQVLANVSTLNRSSLCPTKNQEPHLLLKKGSALNLDQMPLPHSSSTLNLSALLLQQNHLVAEGDIPQSARCFYDTTQQRQQVKLSSPVAAPRVLMGLNPQIVKNLAKNLPKQGPLQHNQLSMKNIFAKKSVKASTSNKRMEQRESIQ